MNRHILIIISIFAVCLFLSCASNMPPETGKSVNTEKEQEDYLILADALAEESSIPGGPNFLEITEEKVRDILKNPASRTIQQHATLTLGKLKKFSAICERNPDKRAQLMDEAIEMLDKFIKENPDYSGISEAKFELSELLQESVRCIGGGSRTTEQIESTYARINEDLKAMITEYQKMLDVTQDADKREEGDNKIMGASYTLGLNFYYQGLLYDRGSENRKKYLKEAIKTFQIVMLNYGDKLLSYEAADYLGLCYYELENYKTAKIYFASVTKLYEGVEEPIGEEIGEVGDIIQRGHAHLAMVYNATKEYSEAVKTVDKLFILFPKNTTDEWMEMGLLEKAKALFYIGNKEPALAEQQERLKKRKEWQILNDDCSKWERKGHSRSDIYIDENNRIVLKNPNPFTETIITNDNDGEQWKDFTVEVEFKVSSGSFKMFLRSQVAAINTEESTSQTVTGIAIPFPGEVSAEWQKYTIELKGRKLTVSGTGLLEPKIVYVFEEAGKIGISIKGGDNIIVKELKAKIIE